MLCKTISNILTYENQFHELIIIDQTKEHEEKTKLFLEKLSYNKKIKYIYIDFPNLPNARNTGINNSTGDIILFFDDDIEINEDTIPSHIKEYNNNNKTGCVTGKVNIFNINPNNNIVLHNSGKIKKIIKHLIFFLMSKKASHVGAFGVISNFTNNKKLSGETCIGCNMSFRKEIFNKCGVFDLNFTGNAIREDTDMSVRLRRVGYGIIYNPQASVIHFMDNSGGTRTAQSESYWHTIFKNQCYFYLKNFHYKYYHILFLQIFDIIRCNKSKHKAASIFKNSYKEAKQLLRKN